LQNLWRHIQQLGFATDYNNTESVRTFFRSFAIIAFAPVEDTYVAFDHLKSSYPAEWKKYLTFADYSSPCLLMKVGMSIVAPSMVNPELQITLKLGTMQ
jgi:hypothetical protein